VLRSLQKRRLGRSRRTADFDRFWRPLFFNLDAEAGFLISVADHGRGLWRTVEVRQGATPSELITERDNGASVTSDDIDDDDADELIEHPGWRLELRVARDPQLKSQQQVVGRGNRALLPAAVTGVGSVWIAPSANVGTSDVRYVSELKQSGREAMLLELLRGVDGRLSSIELLAPGGDVAELFVRLDHETPLLPLALMGDGFQRCFEIGAAAAAHNWPTLFVDEIENGLHHTVLEHLWRWLAMVSRQRKLQIFATTHSEECIHAAARAFHGLEDDGLRVVRLDLLGAAGRASIYDRALVETAERTGTEIRG
jgi:hypothetical protein